jgi:hypothetical protein
MNTQEIVNPCLTYRDEEGRIQFSQIRENPEHWFFKVFGPEVPEEMKIEGQGPPPLFFVSQDFWEINVRDEQHREIFTANSKGRWVISFWGNEKNFPEVRIANSGYMLVQQGGKTYQRFQDGTWLCDGIPVSP